MPSLADIANVLLERNPAHPPESWNRGVRNVAQALGGSLADLATFPGRYASGQTGYQPGQMASEQPGATNWAPEMALNMLGAPAMTGGVPGMGSGIRAYHGSPHDFDKFDLSKIGTGEGAQAYGHGLYFAENEGVARSYKAAGQPNYLNVDRITAAKDLLKEAGGDRSAALAMAQARMSSTGKYSEGKLWQDVINNFDDLVGKGPGKMYEVNINAKPEQFLDWDKPLASQPSALGVPDLGMLESKQKDMLARLFELEKTGQHMTPEGAALRSQLDAYANSINRYHVQNKTGGDYYKKFALETGGIEQATKAMKDAGIPGIKYLDQGSRTAGAGTNNYVVFDDKIIDIMRKYGIAGLFGLGAASSEYKNQ